MTTLAAALTNSATEMRVNAADADPAEYYTIDSEVIRVLANSTTVQDGLSPERSVDTTLWQIQRGHGPTTPASHLSGATLTPFPGAGGGAAEEGTVVVQLTGAETTYGHFYVGDEDPDVDFGGELATGDIWIDTLGGVPFSHKERNVANDGWVWSPMIAKDALGVELSSVEVGPTYSAIYATIGAGPGQAEVHVQNDGRINLNSGDTSITIEGDGSVNVNTVDGTSRVAIAPDGSIVLTNSALAGVNLLADGSIGLATANGSIGMVADGTITLNSVGALVTFPAAGGITVLGLPTADPVAAGALWNDTGTVKVSAG